MQTLIGDDGTKFDEDWKEESSIFKCVGDKFMIYLLAHALIIDQVVDFFSCPLTHQCKIDLHIKGA